MDILTDILSEDKFIQIGYAVFVYQLFIRNSADFLSIMHCLP